MFSLNEVQLAGLLTHEIELRSTENGRNFCRFNLATEGRTRNQSGKVSKVFENHRCVIVGDNARIFEEKCQSGTNLYIKGNLKSRFVNSEVDGVALKQEIIEIIVTAFQVIADGKVDMGDPENLATAVYAEPTPAEDMPFY